MAKKKCYLFVGNPGTGKSTIMNGLAGKAVFKAEPSFSGSGVTFQFDIAEVPGVGLLMDTPGLADVEMKKKASEAITSAKTERFLQGVFRDYTAVWENSLCGQSHNEVDLGVRTNH